jgi:hypothetical protein
MKSKVIMVRGDDGSMKKVLIASDGRGGVTRTKEGEGPLVAPSSQKAAKGGKAGKKPNKPKKIMNPMMDMSLEPDEDDAWGGGTWSDSRTRSAMGESAIKCPSPLNVGKYTNIRP